LARAVSSPRFDRDAGAMQARQNLRVRSFQPNLMMKQQEQQVRRRARAKYQMRRTIQTEIAAGRVLEARFRDRSRRRRSQLRIQRRFSASLELPREEFPIRRERE